MRYRWGETVKRFGVSCCSFALRESYTFSGLEWIIFKVCFIPFDDHRHDGQREFCGKYKELWYARSESYFTIPRKVSENSCYWFFKKWLMNSSFKNIFFHKNYFSLFFQKLFCILQSNKLEIAARNIIYEPLIRYNASFVNDSEFTPNKTSRKK